MKLKTTLHPDAVPRRPRISSDAQMHCWRVTFDGIVSMIDGLATLEDAMSAVNKYYCDLKYIQMKILFSQWISDFEFKTWERFTIPLAKQMRDGHHVPEYWRVPAFTDRQDHPFVKFPVFGEEFND